VRLLVRASIIYWCLSSLPACWRAGLLRRIKYIVVSTLTNTWHQEWFLLYWRRTDSLINEILASGIGSMGAMGGLRQWVQHCWHRLAWHRMVFMEVDISHPRYPLLLLILNQIVQWTVVVHFEFDAERLRLLPKPILWGVRSWGAWNGRRLAVGMGRMD
jgi:hypothetical protein